MLLFCFWNTSRKKCKIRNNVWLVFHKIKAILHLIFLYDKTTKITLLKCNYMDLLLILA